MFCLDRERDSLAALPICALEILLVLNDAESYHWSPSLRVEAVFHANTRFHRGRCPDYC